MPALGHPRLRGSGCTVIPCTNQALRSPGVELGPPPGLGTGCTAPTAAAARDHRPLCYLSPGLEADAEEERDAPCRGERRSVLCKAKTAKGTKQGELSSVQGIVCAAHLERGCLGALRAVCLRWLHTAAVGDAVSSTQAARAHRHVLAAGCMQATAVHSVPPLARCPVLASWSGPWAKLWASKVTSCAPLWVRRRVATHRLRALSDTSC